MSLESFHHSRIECEGVFDDERQNQSELKRGKTERKGREGKGELEGFTLACVLATWMLGCGLQVANSRFTNHS